MKGIAIIVGIVFALILGIALTPFTIIGTGERGVVLHFGAVDRTLAQGIHWITPFVESVEKVDVQTAKEQVDVSAASKDLQTVKAVVALNYNVVPERVGQLYSEIGMDYKAKVIDPAIQEAVKAATAKYDASELVTKRELVKDEIKDLLSKRLSEVYIQTSEVSIVNFDFSADFNTAIEAKVTAEQSALQAKNKLEQIKFEAEQTIATARAESEAIRLKSDAANNEKYVALQRIEVQRAFAEKWNGQLPTNMYGSAPLPFLQLEK